MARLMEKFVCGFAVAGLVLMIAAMVVGPSMYRSSGRSRIAESEHVWRVILFLNEPVSYSKLPGRLALVIDVMTLLLWAGVIGLVWTWLALRRERRGGRK